MNHLRNFYPTLLARTLRAYPRVSKHNFDSLVMMHLKIVNPSLYYEVLIDHPDGNEEEKFYPYWLDKLDLITRGKVFEIFMAGLRSLDPFHEISAETLVTVDGELGRYFKQDHLHKFFYQTYFGEIKRASLRRSRQNRASEASACKQKTIEAKIKKNLKAWEHSKRYKLKRVRDFDRLKFIKKFSLLKPLEKLSLILNDDIDFPLISIPDEALFKADLVLRSEIKKTFSKKETSILTKKFLCKKGRDRGRNWSSILKAF